MDIYKSLLIWFISFGCKMNNKQNLGNEHETKFSVETSLPLLSQDLETIQLFSYVVTEEFPSWSVKMPKEGKEGR